MVSTLPDWTGHASGPHPEQSYSLPSSHDIRYKPEHGRSPKHYSRVTAPLYSQPSPWALRARTAPAGPTEPWRHTGYYSETSFDDPRAICLIDDSEDDGHDVGSDSESEGDEDRMSMDVDENSSVAPAPARERSRKVRTPFAPLDISPATGKRKHEDPHLALPPPSPTGDTSMTFEPYDLPDYESVMDDHDNSLEDVLAGLNAGENIYPIRLCSFCGRPACSSPHSSLGHLELREMYDDVDDTYNVFDTLQEAQSLPKSPSAERRARRTTKYFGAPPNTADWLIDKVMQPSRPRSTCYSGVASPLAPRPDFRYRRIRCSHGNCVFVGASIEHWKHHMQTFQHNAYSVTRRH